MYYSAEEWIDLFYKNNVIKLLNSGMTYKEISGLLKDRGYIVSPDAIRQALKRLGYFHDKDREEFITKEEKEFNDNFVFVDIEETIDSIAKKRYYTSFHNGFYYEDRETVKVDIDKNIYEEYVKLANENECELDDEYMTMVLLEALEKLKPVDRIRDFKLREFKEYYEYSKEEIEFMLELEKKGYELGDPNVLEWIDNDEDLNIISFIESDKKRKLNIENWLLTRRR